VAAAAAAAVSAVATVSALSDGGRAEMRVATGRVTAAPASSADPTGEPTGGTVCGFGTRPFPAAAAAAGLPVPVPRASDARSAVYRLIGRAA
jgi:hypothetical protein